LFHLFKITQSLFFGGGGGGGGGGGALKKCFLGLRQTALLSAEGKNHILLVNMLVKKYLLVFQKMLC
jgi:hypothetical protein